MTKDREPLDDDILDAVTGGTTVNSNDCAAYTFKGVGSPDKTCNTCLRKGTPLCPFGK